MDCLIIDNDLFDAPKLYKLISKYLTKYLKNKDTFIIDIHNTTEYDNGKIDKDIYSLGKNKKFNIIFLSFDGNNERIKHNNEIINSTEIFESSPKIFIKYRKKHYIISAILILLKNLKFDRKVTFIDDNYKNIIDAKKLTKTFDNLSIIHYVKHIDINRHKKYDESVNDLSHKI